MTATLYAIDGDANQRLLEQEEQRRQDLIESAVSSFAPHLRNTPGLQVIHLYSSNSALRKTIRDAFEGSRTIVVEYVRGDGRERKNRNEIQQDVDVWLNIPKTADLVVTKSGMNFRTELLAAQLHALPLCLPEGLDYLYKRLERASALVLVGAEQGRRA